MADPGDSTVPPEDSGRSQLFEAAWRRTGCPLSQLWTQYLGLGGTVDLFSLDAFLHGLVPLEHGQQDVLANTINEQLDDLYQAVKVPYLHPLATPTTSSRDPLTVLDELFAHRPGGSTEESVTEA